MVALDVIKVHPSAFADPIVGLLGKGYDMFLASVAQTARNASKTFLAFGITAAIIIDRHHRCTVAIDSGQRCAY